MVSAEKGSPPRIMQEGPGNHPVFVFSHPNHELAVFGMVQGLDPARLIFLTDGGGPDRVEQTRQGLARVGREDRATFLNHREVDFYEGVLRRDDGYFAGVAAEVRSILDEERPSTVFADSIEFYNPVHDLAVPILHRSLREVPDCQLFEVPLVAQVNRSDYIVQRFPKADTSSLYSYRLSERELEEKVHARNEVYGLLRDQFGSTLQNLTPEYLGEEYARVVPLGEMRWWDDRYVLRYDRRGQELFAEGEVSEAITYGDHFVPLVTNLLAAV